MVSRGGGLAVYETGTVLNLISLLLILKKRQHKIAINDEQINRRIDDDDIILCSNCGKGEESAGDLKACTSCKVVKYCNRDCQIAHRPQHKKSV